MDNNHNQNQNHNSNDILISVDPISPQETTPPTPPSATTQQSSNTPTSPLVSPAHLRLPSQNDEPREPIILPTVEPDYGFPLQPSSNSIDPMSPDTINGAIGGVGGGNGVDYSDKSQDFPRPLSPPHLPIHHALRGGGDAYYRYPHSGNATPSVRSLRLPGHQQSNRPYNPSLFRNNEYHPPMGGHRNVDGQHDTSKPMVIDYAGLDTSVAEAALIENGFKRNNAFMDSPGGVLRGEFETKESDAGSNKLERTASISSSNFHAAGPTSANSGQSEFRRRSARKASFYSERAPRPPLPESLRYTFYSPATGVVQAPSMPQILSGCTLQTPDGGSKTPAVFSDLLKDGCYWLDILDPSDFDMQILAKHFHVHPLTIEDISTEEQREKYEVFRHYYFVCFRTFDQDYNSGSYLQPASMYSVVFRDGIMTFHFRPADHHMNVLRRIEQLHSHITLTPDWINYALLDDITDSFASPIQTIEYEVDSIDDLVLLLRENETTDMLRRIGSCRKNVMAMSRLLANKADVVRGLMKRFDERYAVAPLAPSSAPAVVTTTAAPAGATGAPSVKNDDPGHATNNMLSAPGLQQQHHHHHRDGEILLYLGDILDHVLTMLQSLGSYEKILDRSHSNYLAQISLEINQLSNKTNEVVGTLTFFASLIVPMTFLTGLWGMNVHVPGQPGQDPGEPLNWWWALLGAMAIYCVIAVLLGKKYGLIFQ
ncbi:CorA metal ion transporter [Mortierella hygrophila]|uniref:CorA metal ion transporter n=1 Tax=Mortierella hygrophila TaxID=979708 RepID=A0A9P6FHR3_9FUNG|nr:CorA metal ion transporter [Mortierella hygrophila]